MALLTGLFLVVYFGNASQQTVEQPLVDIKTIDTLRAQFNLDQGKTRLIILVSPT